MPFLKTHSFKKGDRVRLSSWALSLPGCPHGLSHTFRSFALRNRTGTILDDFGGFSNPKVVFTNDNYEYFIPMSWLVPAPEEKKQEKEHE